MGKSYQVKKHRYLSILCVKLEQSCSHPCKRVHNANLLYLERVKSEIILKIKVLKGGRCLLNVFGKLDPLKMLRLAQGIKNLEEISCYREGNAAKFKW